MADAKVKDFKDYQGPTSRQYTIDIDLDNNLYPQKKYYLDILSQRNACVTIQMTGMTGTSGDVFLRKANRPGAKVFDFAPVESETLVDDDTIVIEPTASLVCRYLVVDLSGVTFGSTGKMQIQVTAKPY